MAGPAPDSLPAVVPVLVAPEPVWRRALSSQSPRLLTAPCRSWSSWRMVTAPVSRLMVGAEVEPAAATVPKCRRCLDRERTWQLRFAPDERAAGDGASIAADELVRVIRPGSMVLPEEVPAVVPPGVAPGVAPGIAPGGRSWCRWAGCGSDRHRLARWRRGSDGCCSPGRLWRR